MTAVAAHAKRLANEVVQIEPAHNRAALAAAGRLYRAAYITRNLLVVEAVGDAIDMPDTIRVRFLAEDEWPAPTREAHRLTVELFELALGGAAKAEAAWEAGTLPDAEYQMMRARWARVVEVFERLPGCITWEN